MIDERFLRTAKILEVSGVKKLNKSKVAIIGVGAVGGYVLEGLARAGVGEFLLIDFDKFDITNINRQILALTSTIGLSKAEIAKNRVLDINPNAKVEIVRTFVKSDNIGEIIKGKFDYVIDAIDTIGAKAEVIKYLLNNDYRFISSMGAALRLDPSKIRIGRLDKVKHCGLSRVLRKKLRRDGYDLKKVKCVSSDEVVAEETIAKIEKEDGKKSVIGSMPTITAIYGLTIANEVIDRKSVV